MTDNTEAKEAPAPGIQQSADQPKQEQRADELGYLPVQRKLVSRIQDSIDENGRYSRKLKDLSLGYSAGKGISEYEAKIEIGQLFERDMGMGIKNYLEQHRIERGLEVDRDTGRDGR